MQPRLHHRRNRNAEHGQRTNEFAAHDSYRGKQELLFTLVFFTQNWMAVIEVIEKLGELECVLGEIRGFGGGDALVDHERGF